MPTDASRHLLALPVLVPLVAAFLALLLQRRGLRWQRVVSVASTWVLLDVAIRLMALADGGAHSVYRVGDWPVPVGIVLVLDRLAALMVLLTAIVAVFSLWHAVHGTDEEGAHFHALFQLQLAGIGGAFLAGDLFNLFVFFEILLIASYCLLVYGGTTARLRSGVHYVVLNLVGSTCFLIAIGTLYGLVGTLNLAHIAERVARLEPGDAGIVRSAALVLMVVFALKAALVPLSFWLPRAYAAASPPIAAIFALMTKVGVYAIIRVSLLVFGPDAGVASGTVVPWLLPVALATIVMGAVGCAGAGDVRRLQGYLLLTSVGTMVAAASAFTAEGLTAALYYLAHSTIITAAMFLVVGLTTGESRAAPRVSALFFVGAIALAGLPPFSGFIGKVLILQSVPSGLAGRWIWWTILMSSAISVVALARVGTALFWERSHHDAPRYDAAPSGLSLPPAAAPYLPAAGLLSVMVVLTVLSGGVSAFTARAAEQLLMPGAYMRAVLDTPGGR